MNSQALARSERSESRAVAPGGANRRLRRVIAAAAIGAAITLLASCNGGGGSGNPTFLACDNTLAALFKPDANTTVLLVKSFKKGDPLALSGTPATPPPPAAPNDVCVVKLLVGPGNPGPSGAPSTSAGIGIEVWLPSVDNYNGRLHALGGGGWAGGTAVTSTTVLAGTAASSAGLGAFTVAGVEGAVSAVTDTGHTIGNGSFAMNPDGTINTVLWNDFAQRGIHEEVVKAKALAQAMFGSQPRYAYWDGFSTGGRQAHKLAQVYPAELNGILAGAPAFNWSKFITTELYPQIVYQRDLGGVALTSGQLTLLGNAAINACDVVVGQHLGYIPDPSTCTYDPTQDSSVICAANGGTNSTANCVTPVQAAAQNKIWYGQTPDGSVPSPAMDNGFGTTPSPNQRWYGLARGAASGLAGPTPFTIATDQVALELQDPTIATPAFTNATGNGADKWKQLSYPQLSNAFDLGVSLQPSFGNINTDNPDLSGLKNANTRMIMYHGLGDVLIPPQGSINYYNRVANQMGGIASIQTFYRFYLIPGMTHGIGNGETNVNANPPLPTHDQLYNALTDWVEKGIPPSRIDISTTPTTTFPIVKSRPICPYPQKGTYTGGDVNAASSYTCS
jgi:feruloyl esterase